MAAKKKTNAPVCTECGATGTGAEFRIFSKYGFGKYCVPCEDVATEARAIRAIALAAG